MTDLVSLLDLADLAMARSEGVVPDGPREDLARIVRRARRKLGYVGDVLVVALAGGTGSGKSSVINALVGEVVVQTGVVRPTTSIATAVIPRLKSDAYTQLLSDLGVEDSVESPELRFTILVDLPDFDSFEVRHRHIVESVLPVVDAVIWVLDPEKYSDDVMHKEFLAGLVPYESQFVFVLNKVDLLGREAERVVDDAAGLLASDGFVQPEVFGTIAAGPKVDVTELIASLYARFDTKRTVISKLIIDLRVAANTGWAAAREVASTATDRARIDEVGLSAATFVLLGVEAIVLLEED
jgi:GTP-binding protein EngB required for normal cell division